MARALMFQGTGSDVGKSMLVAGLGRALSRRGYSVRPFKPQNMSNNAAVTPEGLEIGRAQALQARACCVAPHSDMNPVLLKPNSESGAQVVVHGRVHSNSQAKDYLSLKASLLTPVLESFYRLVEGVDFVLVEGAGSPAETNLRANDIANMGFADATATPVVLVADIERGGVIASVVGTHAVLNPTDRQLMRGYIVNKFRGDVSLFDGGIQEITKHTGLDCLGVIPYFDQASTLPAEDSLSLPKIGGYAPAGFPAERILEVAILRLPRIANFDDFDPLIAEDSVHVRFVEPGTALPGNADLVVIPGSKSTRADLDALRSSDWDDDLRAHLRRGGAVLGICAGFQMLGRTIIDDHGVEGPAGRCDGLGLLDLETRFGRQKRLVRCEGEDLHSGLPVEGFEMHMGRSFGEALGRPWLEIDGKQHGAHSEDGRIFGCYVHGLFARDAFRRSFLSRIGHTARGLLCYENEVESALNALAEHLETHLRIDALVALASEVKSGWSEKTRFKSVPKWQRSPSAR